MKIKAVLFDMDGVLIEAKDWHYDALNKALDLFGINISREDHLSTFDGLPTLKKLEYLSVHRGLPKELHGFINQLKQKYTMDIVYTGCNPVFIHQYALSKLHSLGYKTAVCSNSVRNSVEVMMNLAGLDQYLDLLISNEDVSNGKPDPEMYIKAINAFELNPKECLIIEDNENGIKAARASGGNLLVVKEVTDVTYSNIINRINELELEAD
jgi:beta-phosphoglucomutase-like phosphatase (HAD superfamily)